MRQTFELDDAGSIHAELAPPFEVYRPREQLAPFVLCSPHSGRVYPTALTRASRLAPSALRKSEDCFVDELFTGVAELGVPMIAARFPRAYVDVNREPYELDPELFGEPLPAYANQSSIRVAGGLGTIPRVVADQENIYPGPIPLAVAFQRIELLYKPFHSALTGLIGETCATFGYAILIDCHSMPSASMAQPAGARPDFVIGDRFGSSCDVRVTRLVRETLMGTGFAVHLNRPYAGGFITEHYGRPHQSVHAIQIEINRGLYLDEQRCVPTAGFRQLQQSLQSFAKRLFCQLPQAISARAMAAE